MVVSLPWGKSNPFDSDTFMAQVKKVFVRFHFLVRTFEFITPLLAIDPNFRPGTSKWLQLSGTSTTKIETWKKAMCVMEKWRFSPSKSRFLAAQK